MRERGLLGLLVLALVACGNSSKKGDDDATGGSSSAGMSGTTGAAGSTSGAGGSGAGGGTGGTPAATGGTAGNDTGGSGGLGAGGTAANGGAHSGGNGGAAAGGAAAGMAGRGPCDHQLDQPGCWRTRDLSGYTGNTQSFYGAVFDGRYVTFLDNFSSVLSAVQVRFDTRSDFTSNTAWQSVDIHTYIDSTMVGGVFDGRYVYSPGRPLNVNAAGDVVDESVIVRLDPQAAFDSADSWSSFNLSTVRGDNDPTVPGYQGVEFDGRYLYFAPTYAELGDTSPLSGSIARYDTMREFTDASAWDAFDTTTLDASAAGFTGAVFDGTYVYFVPSYGMDRTTAVVTRHDTTGDFADAATWETFDTATLDAAAKDFSGGVFDGRYVYFVPTDTLSQGLITRFDTQGTFTDAAAWSTVNPGPLAPTHSAWSFVCGAFDGHYVYFVSRDGYLLRYDPDTAFDATASWTSQRVSTVADSLSTNFTDATFDGRYLYLSASGFSHMVQYDAGGSGKLPPWFHGSFL